MLAPKAVKRAIDIFENFGSPASIWVTVLSSRSGEDFVEEAFTSDSVSSFLNFVWESCLEDFIWSIVSSLSESPAEISVTVSRSVSGAALVKAVSIWDSEISCLVTVDSFL